MYFYIKFLEYVLRLKKKINLIKYNIRCNSIIDSFKDIAGNRRSPLIYVYCLAYNDSIPLIIQPFEYYPTVIPSRIPCRSDLS